MCFQLFLVLLLSSNCLMEIVEKSSSQNNNNKSKRGVYTNGFFSNIGSGIVQEYQPFGYSNLNIYSHPNIERFVYNTPEESSDDTSSNYNIHTVLTTDKSNRDYIMPVSTSKLDINQNDYIVSHKYFEPVEISNENQMRKEINIPTTSYHGTLDQQSLQNNQTKKLFIPNIMSQNKTFINWKNDDSYIIPKQNSYVTSRNFSNSVNNLNLKGEHNMQSNRFVSESNNSPEIEHSDQNFRNMYDYYPYFSYSQSPQQSYLTAYEPYENQLQQNVDYFQKPIEHSSSHVNYQQPNNNIYNTQHPTTTTPPTTSNAILLTGGYYKNDRYDKNHNEYYPGLGGFGKRISALIRHFFFGANRSNVNDMKTKQTNDTVINDSLFGSLTNSIENNQTNYKSFSKFGHG